MDLRTASALAALALLLHGGLGGAQAAPPSGPSTPGGPSSTPGSAIVYTPGGGAFATPPPTTPPPGPGTSGTPAPATTTLPFDFKVPPPGASSLPAPSGAQLAFPLLREDRIEPGQLVVAHSSQGAAAALAQFSRRYGVKPIEVIELPALAWTLAVYQLPTNTAAAELRLRLMREQPKLLADFNMRYAAMGKPRLYSRTSIGLLAMDTTRAGHGVRVGMLDGFVTAAGILDTRKLITRNLLAPADRPAAAGHATAVAALIAGRDRVNEFSGIAPDAELYAGAIMRARAGIEETTTRSVVVGLDWLLQARAQVANLSFGGPPNRVLAAAVFATLQRAVVVVAAAGNDGARAEPAYPAAYPGVIAVTAIDAGEQIYEHANRGSYVTISAPGVDVWIPDGATGHYVSGTSYASAIVTGAVALALSVHRGVTPPSLQARLCATAKDLGAPGNDPVFGCGLLQMKEIFSASR